MSDNYTNKELLIVDDEKLFLKVLERMFSKLYNVTTAESGEDALELLKNGLKPAVIFSDQKMRGMTGSQFLEKSLEYTPETTRIILTGYTDPKAIISCINQGHAYMYLTKPSDNLELFQAAHIAFDHYHSQLAQKTSIGQSKSDISDIKQGMEKCNSENQRLNELLAKAKAENERLQEEIQNSKNSIEELNKLIEEVNVENSDLNDRIVKVEESNQKLEVELEDTRVFPNQSILALSEIIKRYEKFYFNDHSSHVSNIVKALAEELGYSPERTSILVVTCLLHNIVLIGMPEEFQLMDPNECDGYTRKRYFSYFKRSIASLQKIQLLKHHSEIISQIWEHSDGTGYPKGLKGEAIRQDAQILAIANIYHNEVYRLLEEDYQTLKENGHIKQAKATSAIRHKNSLRNFFKKAKWFDVDVFRTFHDLAKHKEVKSLVPAKDELVIDLRTHYGIKDVSEIQAESENGEMKEVVDTHAKELGQELDIDAAEDNVLYDERTIDAIDTKAGMITVHNVVTVSGILVVRGDRRIDAALAKKIKQLVQSEMIDEKITVMVPDYY